MGIISVNNPTLLDIGNAMAPDNSIAPVIEILAKTDECMQDWTMLEGNMPTGHKTTQRASETTPTWRKMNQGVQPSSSTRVSIVDTCAMLEDYGEVDKAMADLNSNAAAYRLSEDTAVIQGIGSAATRALFYGDEKINPEQFTGFSPRYNSLAGKNNSENIIDANTPTTKGVGNYASIWLVGWGEQSIHGIYPKGLESGVQMRDLGEVTVENAGSASDGKGGRMQAYRSHYKWNLGLTVRDWRYAVRICNIDRSILKAKPVIADEDVNLPDLMFQAMERLPHQASAKYAWYMDRSVITKLRQQSSDGVKNSTLTIENVGGAMVQQFSGYPIRRVDTLSQKETLVT